jgi:hypothetical protein
MYSDVTVILQSKPGKRLLVQSSSSSRARSKSLMNQTTFDVPDPLVVHVLLLTHEFMNNKICLPNSWYPQCHRSMFLTCPKHTDDDNPSLIYCGRLVMADAWLFLLVLFSAAMSQTVLCLFCLSKGRAIFVGATSLVLQQCAIITIITCFTYAA